ncbi:MAG: glycosyltransferase family 4 protein [Nitrospinae bacterium]|nr:glycosyltransferase family 4 protein [Nitrospinota bacterium]
MQNIAIDCRAITKQNTGIGNWTYNIVSEFLKVNNQYCVYLFVNEPCQFDVGNNDMGNLIPVNVGIDEHPENELYENFKLPSLLKELNISLYISSPFRLPMRKLPCITIAVVFDLTSFLCPESMPLTFRIYNWFSIIWSTKRADHLITISKSVLTEINERFPFTTERIEVIEPAVSQGFYLKPSQEEKNAATQKYSLPQNFLLFVGTIEPRKNLDFLVAVLENEAIKMPLVIVGNKGWKSDKTYAKLLELQKQKKVILTCFVAPNELPIFFHLAQAFILPSKYEGFGIPLLEAAAANTPVYCSDIPVFKEIGESKFTYFSVQNNKELLGYLSSLPVKDEESSDLQSIAKKYSWETSGKKLLTLINKLLNTEVQ